MRHRGTASNMLHLVYHWEQTLELLGSLVMYSGKFNSYQTLI